MEVKGRDLIDGFPKIVVVTGAEVREGLGEPVAAIVSAVHACLEQAPPERSADLVDTGIALTGGGALLRGLDQLLRKETALPITVTDDPLTCVARGAGQLLDTIDLLRRVAILGYVVRRQRYRLSLRTALDEMLLGHGSIAPKCCHAIPLIVPS